MRIVGVEFPPLPIPSQRQSAFSHRAVSQAASYDTSHKRNNDSYHIRSHRKLNDIMTDTRQFTQNLRRLLTITASIREVFPPSRAKSRDLGG